MRTRTSLGRLLVVGVLLIFSGALCAQEHYPNHPIRFITTCDIEDGGCDKNVVIFLNVTVVAEAFKIQEQ